MTSRRRRASAALVAVVIASIVGGGLASRWLTSPNEVAASTEPPAPTLLTAPLERRVVATIMPGQIRTRTRPPIIIASPPTAASPAIITALPVAAGATLGETQVIAKVNERPIIAISGSVPAFRSLTPGDRGADVAQLQAALVRAGYPITDPPGTFGGDTSDALERLAADRGFDPAPTPPERAEAASAAEAAVRDAERRLADDTAADEETRRAQVEAVRAARQASQAAQFRLGAWLPLGEYAVAPQLPARVESVPITVGAAASGPLLHLSGGPTALIASDFPAGTPNAPGTPLRLTLRDGSERPGHIVGPATDPGDSSLQGDPGTARASDDDAPITDAPAAAEPPVPAGAVEVTPDDAAVPVEQVTAVAVVGDATPGPVLAAPLSAVAGATDGRPAVKVLREDGNVDLVTVRLGRSGDGRVELVDPDPRLTDGARVLVGDGAESGTSGGVAGGGGGE